MNNFFRKFAHATSDLVGSTWAFILGLVVIVSWGATGSIFQYSDTWQLLINTSTTIVTFLMVFVIQHTQNRDAKAIHLKLDELIRGVKGARTEMVALETCTDEGAGRLSEGVREAARAAVETGGGATLRRGPGPGDVAE